LRNCTQNQTLPIIIRDGLQPLSRMSLAVLLPQARKREWEMARQPTSQPLPLPPAGNLVAVAMFTVVDPTQIVRFWPQLSLRGEKQCWPRRAILKAKIFLNTCVWSGIQTGLPVSINL
jgi:hypothetical protein